MGMISQDRPKGHLGLGVVHIIVNINSKKGSWPNGDTDSGQTDANTHYWTELILIFTR